MSKETQLILKIIAVVLIIFSFLGCALGFVLQAEAILQSTILTDTSTEQGIGRTIMLFSLIVMVLAFIPSILYAIGKRWNQDK